LLSAEFFLSHNTRTLISAGTLHGDLSVLQMLCLV